MSSPGGADELRHCRQPAALLEFIKCTRFHGIRVISAEFCFASRRTGRHRRPGFNRAARPHIEGNVMSTAAERAAQLDLVARLKSAYPELPDAPTPDLLDHDRIT